PPRRLATNRGRAAFPGGRQTPWPFWRPRPAGVLHGPRGEVGDPPRRRFKMPRRFGDDLACTEQDGRGPAAARTHQGQQQLGALIRLGQPKGGPLTHLTTLSTTGGRIASQVG